VSDLSKIINLRKILAIQKRLAYLSDQFDSVKKINEELYRLKDREKSTTHDEPPIVSTEALKKHLRVIGFDPVYGARPLRRIVNEVIVDEIALQIVEGKIKALDKVIADIKMGKAVIAVKKPS
jgi:ATP-dependent Clp protease ATP-binding subunit ClpA